VHDEPAPTEGAQEPEPPYYVAVTRSGMCMRGTLRAHREPSTRSGRKFMRVDQDDEVIYVGVADDKAKLACASKDGRALICAVDEVSLLAGPGKGVMLIKLDDKDELVAARLLRSGNDALVVEKESGTELSISTRKYQPVSRGGKGHAMFQRGSVAKVVPEVPVVPSLEEEGES
jgi:DNA gyrase subunit A